MSSTFSNHSEKQFVLSGSSGLQNVNFVHMTISVQFNVCRENFTGYGIWGGGQG